MDYLLPSDATMKRMASEYAKIKRVCIPRRANAFAIEEETEMQKAHLLVELAQKDMDKSDFDFRKKGAMLCPMFGVSCSREVQSNQQKPMPQTQPKNSDLVTVSSNLLSARSVSVLIALLQLLVRM